MNLINFTHRLKWYVTRYYVKRSTSLNNLKPLLYYQTQNSKQLFQNTFLALTCPNMSFGHIKVFWMIKLNFFPCVLRCQSLCSSSGPCWSTYLNRKFELNCYGPNRIAAFKYHRVRQSDNGDRCRQDHLLPHLQLNPAGSWCGYGLLYGENPLGWGTLQVSI